MLSTDTPLWPASEQLNDTGFFHTKPVRVERVENLVQLVVRTCTCLRLYRGRQAYMYYFIYHTRVICFILVHYRFRACEARTRVVATAAPVASAALVSTVCVIPWSRRLARARYHVWHLQAHCGGVA